MRKCAFYSFLIIFLTFLVFAGPIFSVKAEDLKSTISDYHKIKSGIGVTSTEETEGTTTVDPQLTQKKEQLNKIISVLVQATNNQKEQVAALKSLEQLKKDQLSQILQLTIDGLMAQNSKITAANDSEALKKIAEAVQTNWATGQSDYKKNLLSDLSDGMTSASGKLEIQLQEIKSQSDALKNKNKDTTILENKIKDAENAINNGKARSQSSLQKIAGMSKDVDAEAVMQDVLKTQAEETNFLKSTNDSLNAAKTEVDRLTQKKS